MNTFLCPPSLPNYGQTNCESTPDETSLPQRVMAYAPASMGNFAAGFDFLGAALRPLNGEPMGNVVEAARAETLSLLVEGPYAHRLGGCEPMDNLVMAAYRAYCAALSERNRCAFSVALRLEMHLPPGSGLGSSASSIVATLVSLQAVHGHPLSIKELLAVAGRVEGAHGGGLHLDNVAPSFLGGLRLILDPSDEGGPETRSLPWPEDLWIVVAYPGIEVPTAMARQALPQELPLQQSVLFARNAAGLVNALHSGDRGDIARTLWDPVAEPHRAAFVPGFLSAKKAAQIAGALGGSLSGSGPSQFAVCTPDRVSAVELGMRQALEAEGYEVRTWICALDPRGARVLS
ncbi:MAG: homoserine kinase [Holophaga sp.]|nr:homoserine kinase [Holophaga sp.]